ncbi:MAG: hemolysin III family protein [bacterium]|nr:hemolysin III family protein [bacterium]
MGSESREADEWHPGLSPNSTHEEEWANSITHGIGALLSVAGLAVLVTLAGVWGDAWRVVTFSIYGASLVLLYTASTLYHTVREPRVKKVCRILDHSFIYILIAGTYTPFTLVMLRGGWGWSIFGVVWGLALIGVATKAFVLNRFKSVSVLVYVGMGWIVLIAIKPTIEAVPLGGLAWLAAGGLAYTSGTIFYAWDRLPYNHAIWHVFVMAGSLFQYFAVLFYVLPMTD